MRSILPIGLTLFAVLPALAQERPGNRDLRTRPPITRPTPVPVAVPATAPTTGRSLKDFLGTRVFERDGGTLGTVSDVTMNDKGSISALVVRSGGTFLAVPWRSV